MCEVLPVVPLLYLAVHARYPHSMQLAFLGSFPRPSEEIKTTTITTVVIIIAAASLVTCQALFSGLY